MADKDVRVFGFEIQHIFLSEILGGSAAAEAESGGSCPQPSSIFHGSVH